MKGSSSPVTDEYNEDTDRANDSDDDQWPDSKLVIDLEPKMSATDSKTNNSSTKEEAKADTFAVSENKSNHTETSAKPKGKRGAPKRSEVNNKNDSSKDANKPAGKQKGEKVEKEKPPPNKPGRKRKDKPANSNKSNIPNGGDVKSPLTDNNSNDPYKFETTEEGIAATVSGKKASKVKTEHTAMKDAQTECDWRSVASITEPESLGPCEPGTQVCLEGIVWQETANGVLIVNVTWKGKTYMGTLLDATKHDWSPPSCESPVGDFDGRTPKGRGKRSRVPLSDTFKDINERKLRKEMRKQNGAATSQPPPSPAKSDSGKRKGRTSECDSSEPSTKRGRVSRNGVSSPHGLIECPEPNCGKKYKQMNGLKYHQRNAHHETQTQVSDSASDNEKQEVSSPEEVKKPKRKPKGDKSKLNTSVNDKKSNAKVEDPDDDSNPLVPTIISEVVKTESTAVAKTNTTSVITSTSNSQVNNLSQSSTVPVAAITPQVVKPVCLSTDEKDQNKSPGLSTTPGSTSNRSLAMTPKLLPKSTSNSMAPISTITAPGSFNSTLKPIQPKPTILGEATPNPGLNDLRDHKKLKRKRSASRDDLINGNSSPISESMKSNMHRSDLDSRNGNSNGPQISDSAHILQSPSYSDISDEGEIKNAARRELLPISRHHDTAVGTVRDANPYTPSQYLVATVSPQKMAHEKEQQKVLENARDNPRTSPALKSVEAKKREMESDLKSLEMYKQMMSNSYPPAMWSLPPELLHMMAKEKQRSISPRPNPIKSSPGPQSRDIDSKASNERLKLLKENMDMKNMSHMSNQLHGIHESPRDYSLTGTSNAQRMSDDLKYYMQDKEHEQQKIRTHSPVSKPPSSKPSSDSRPDKMMPRSSPMPPPGSYMHPFVSNPLLPFSNPAMLSGRSAGMPNNFMANYPFPFAAGLPDMKDSPIRPNASPLYTNKNDHKIHELEGVHSSKSPRPSGQGDRPHSAKSQPLLSHGIAPSALFSAYSLQSGMYPPK